MKRITRFLGGLNKGLTRLYLFIIALCVVLVVVGIVWTCNGVKNNVKGDIVVTLGQTVANPSLMMDVNGLQVPDLVVQDKIQIN